MLSPLENARLEVWALGVVARVKAGQPVEDSHVELKREWPKDPNAAARRIAGHANASFGARVLWLIGVDEKAGVVGVDCNELSVWWAKVASEFDGAPPELLDRLLPDESGKAVCALFFNTTRAPYVVRNAAYGKSGAGPMEREVPWREGTAVRSATRNDLVRILVPAAAMPDFECLGGSALLQEWREDNGQFWRIYVGTAVFVTPQDSGLVVVPFHRCTAWIELPGNPIEPAASVVMAVSGRDEFGDTWGGSETLHTAAGELVIRGPGRCMLNAEWRLKRQPPDLAGAEMTVSFQIAAARAPTTALLKLRCIPSLPQSDQRAAWRVVPA
jgi:hypothetical protein